MRLAIDNLHGAVRRDVTAPQHRAWSQPTIRGERRDDQRRTSGAYDSGSAGPSAADTRTGSGRIVRATRLPAGSAVASEVESWARIVVSPRSTVTRLVAPRNVEAITVPTSGPHSPELSDASVTASGRTSATTGPAGVAVSTSGRSRPRTVTVPPPTRPP